MHFDVTVLQKVDSEHWMTRYSSIVILFFKKMGKSVKKLFNNKNL